jgi:hypothetical protein
MFNASCFFFFFEQCLDKLKCIDLSDSHILIQIPDFTGIPMLERLYLSGCRNLVVIHPSIGQLRRLVVLDLAECVSLTNLPTMTTEMQALKILNLYGCSKIKKIPEFKGTMKSLSELDLCKLLLRNYPHQSLFDYPYYTKSKRLQKSGMSSKQHR